MILKGTIVGFTGNREIKTKHGDDIDIQEYYVSVENRFVTGICVLKAVVFNDPNRFSMNEEVYCEVDKYFSKISSMTPIYS